MLLEKVRHFGFSSVQTPKSAHKFENGLGNKIPVWFGKELTKIARNFDLINGKGKPMCYTTTDLLLQNPDCVDARVSAYLDKKSSRQVISQIALLARLRSIFMKFTDDEIGSKVSVAVKQSKKMEDVWEKCPGWWDSNHNLLILQRLNQHGFFNVLSDARGFGPTNEVSFSISTLVSRSL